MTPDAFIITNEELIIHSAFISKDGRGLEARAIVHAIDKHGNCWTGNRTLRIRLRKDKKKA